MPPSQTASGPLCRVHVWVPELISKRGGIQTFSRCLVAALTEILGRNNVQVMAKNDSDLDLKSEQIVALSRGWGSWHSGLRTFVFFSGIIWSAIRLRPQIVIATHLNFGLAGYVLKRLTGIRYWCVAHGIEAWNLNRPAARFGLLRADLILAVSNYTRQRLLTEQSLNPERIVILPNTIDRESMWARPKPAHLMRRHALTVRNKIVLTVARLAEPERYKGYDQILRALPAIKKKIPDVRYVLVGEGGDRARIEGLIRQLDLCGAVVLAGAVPAKELADYYNICDVFAMPSKGEGFGIVYLEALACGKPVLAGNSDGSSEPLQNGKVGVLVDADDVDGIASSLTNILDGTYPLDALYSPERLREESLREFGFDVFKERLSSLLEANAKS